MIHILKHMQTEHAQTSLQCMPSGLSHDIGICICLTWENFTSKWFNMYISKLNIAISWFESYFI